MSAEVGQTFNEHFSDSNLASVVAQKLSKTPGDTITLTDVQNLTLLSITSDYSITDLTGIELFTFLNALIVWNNPIDTLPVNIGNLTNLYGLNLSGNKIKMLPNSLNNLNGDVLNLDDNSLTEFPQDLTALNKIGYLSMSENQLVSIPESIKDMNALSVIDLSKNNFAEIPRVLMDIPLLHTIMLDSNKITEIPVVFNNDSMPNLYNLSLMNNKIKGLPDFSNTTIYYYLNLAENELADRISDNFMGINTQYQRATMAKISFNLNSILPDIVKQYEELKGGFQVFEVTWTVVKPNLEEVVIPGGQETLIEENLSSSYGEFILKLNICSEIPTMLK